ncbi:MAG: putative 4-hydroxybenzoate polyprenyltransferase [Desulfobacterales bacterium]|nr:putative 4-hydroxybenzoate polyprenyltransferase [Desulfobacterales bacterium]
MLERILAYGKMIKFSHAVFALPFAFSAVILAQRQYPIILSDIFWVFLAMIGARSSAMGFNRIADARLDAKNPRTSDREIPSGRLSLFSAILFVIFFSGLFIFSSAMLGKLCFYFSFPLLVLLFSYSYTKRFTWLSHIYLGFVISLAPAGAWLAIAKTFSWPVFILSIALMTYIAGFDILYACQDIKFDKNEGLFSIPAYFGIKKALIIASIIHLTSFCFFFLIYIVFDMNLLYFCAVVIIGLLLIVEHRLIKPDDLSKVNFAFFHVNSLISITLFLGVLADELVRRWM